MTGFVTWLGPEIAAKVLAASKDGIDTVLERCVNDARSNHPFRNVSGAAEASIQAMPATSGSSIVGKWGSYGVKHFIYLELGTRKMPAFPSLRPAADANYRDLAGEIKDSLHF